VSVPAPPTIVSPIPKVPETPTIPEIVSSPAPPEKASTLVVSVKVWLVTGAEKSVVTSAVFEAVYEIAAVTLAFQAVAAAPKVASDVRLENAFNIDNTAAPLADPAALS